ncbi:MAG TPA: head-tail connector protein [Caulobacterales bacterium]|nr:head-tail connector protein [Caulobacterales bacterium]
MDAIVVVTPPTGLPVSLDEAKAHLRVDHADDDTLITALIETARSWLTPPAGWLGRSVVQQGLRLDRPEWPLRPLPLPCGPIADDAVTAVTYFDTANATQTVNPSLYFVDGGALVFTSAFTYPGLYCRPGAVRIAYTAGYATNALPAAIKQAILIMVKDWYDAPGGAPAAGDPPPPAQELLAPFRLYA